MEAYSVVDWTEEAASKTHSTLKALILHYKVLACNLPQLP